MNDKPNPAGAAASRNDPDELVVDARQVSKRYVRTWALKAVDLQVRRGELVTRPTYGEVKLFGLSPKNGGNVRERLGVLPHQSYLYDELTAQENLRFAATMYGIHPDSKDFAEALAHVGLAHVADAQVRTFSSGMRKRLALARATLHDPELVFLDEPYGALDVEGINWVDSFIKELRDARKTLVIATHEIGRALALCDRAVSLHGGRVDFDGPTSQYAGVVSGQTGSIEVGARSR